MRQVAIVAGDFVRTGGMDAANYALASYLARAGRTVHLVSYRVARELAALGDVRFHRVPRFGAYALGAPFLGGFGLAIAAGVAGTGGVVVVNGGNCPFPAINWVHYVHAAYRPDVAGPAPRRAKVRVVHGLNSVTERVALRSARVVVTNSERTRRDVIERMNVDEHRVVTVYYGTDPGRFRPRTEDERLTACRELGWDSRLPRAVFVGALGDRRKGFDVLYDAWRILCARPSWDAQLVVVGSGAELAHWRSRASQDGLGARIAFLGFRSDVPRILAAVDVLVAPTRYEAYGLGVHEAICSGLPALVSTIAGVAERFPPALRGLLLDDPGSASALARALSNWRERASPLRNGVLEFSAHLRTRTWDDMARDLIAQSDAVA